MSRWTRFVAPSLAHAIRRSTLILLAAAVVVAGTLAIEGPPSRSRALPRSEMAQFEAKPGQGFVIFLAKVVNLSVFAYIARRGLRVRL